MAPLIPFLPLLSLFLIPVFADNVTREERDNRLRSRFYKGQAAEQTKAESSSRGMQPPFRHRKVNQDYGPIDVSGLNKRQTFTGAIQMFDSSGALGWVSKDFKAPGLYHCTNDSTTALVVSVDADTSLPTNIKTLNGDSEYTYLGVVLSSSDTELKPGSDNYAFITATNSTPDSSPQPQFVGNSFTRDWADGGHPQEASESAIWFLDPKTFEFSHAYIYTHSDSLVVVVTASQLVYFPGGPNLAMTGDFEAYKSKYGGGQPVTFRLDRSVQV